MINSKLFNGFMKKNSICLIVVVVLLIIMLMPIPVKLKDGGSVEYKAILYKYTKIHRLNEQSSTGYEDGWELKILGMHVAGKTNIVQVNSLPNLPISEIDNIHEEIINKIDELDYHNVASTGVNQSKTGIVVELVDNSKEEQDYFCEHIYSCEYIEFKQGGPYTTSNK